MARAFAHGTGSSAGPPLPLSPPYPHWHGTTRSVAVPKCPCPAPLSQPCGVRLRVVRRQFTLQNKTERLQIQLREEDATNEAYQRQTAREQVRLGEVQEAQARLAKQIAEAVAETSARWLYPLTRDWWHACVSAEARLRGNSPRPGKWRLLGCWVGACWVGPRDAASPPTPPPPLHPPLHSPPPPPHTPSTPRPRPAPRPARRRRCPLSHAQRMHAAHVLSTCGSAAAEEMAEAREKELQAQIASMEAAEAARVEAEMAEEDSMPDAPPGPSIMVTQVRLPRQPHRTPPSPWRGVCIAPPPPVSCPQVAPPPAGPVGGFEL